MPSGFLVKHIEKLLAQACEKAVVPQTREGMGHLEKRLKSSDGYTPTQKYLDESILKGIAKAQKANRTHINLKSEYLHSLAIYLGYETIWEWEQAHFPTTNEDSSNTEPDSDSPEIPNAVYGAPESIDKKASELATTEFLGEMSKQELLHSLHQFNSLLRDDPYNANAHFQAGLCYLQLKMYDQSTKHFKTARNLEPADADFYYYYALSCFRGKRPKTLMPSEIKIIETNLEAAIELSLNNAKYYILKAIIKRDYYLANGLFATAPTIPELLRKASVSESHPHEIQRLLNAMRLPESELLTHIKTQFIRTHEPDQ